MTETLTLISRQGIILLFFFGLLMANLLPMWSLLGVAPNFMSVIIYLWAVYRPDLTSKRLYIIFGLVRDGLFGYPLGMGVFEILLIVSITNLLRRYILGRSYWIVFLGYGVFSITSHSLNWLILSWVKGTLLPFEVVLKTTFLNLLIYPLLCQISVSMQKRIDSLD